MIFKIDNYKSNHKFKQNSTFKLFELFAHFSIQTIRILNFSSVYICVCVMIKGKEAYGIKLHHDEG